MDQPGFALFDTAIGRCGIAWSAAGIVGVQLPEPSDAAAMRRLASAFPLWRGRRRRPRSERRPPGSRPSSAARPTTSPPWRSTRAMSATSTAPSIARRKPSRPAPPTTYGAIAAGLGDPALARAVGQALGRNPWPIVVPCHRVTGADGRMGGFSAPGGRATKLRLLEIEGALAAESLPLFAPPGRAS